MTESTTVSSDHVIKLPNFEGPLELLLHLIEERELEITEVSVAAVTDQYLAHIEAMRVFDLDIASEFVVMASRLLEIKARTLLPPPPRDTASEDGDNGDDPRAEIVRRLQQYRQIRQAAELLRDRGEREALRFPRTPEEIAALTVEVGLEGLTLADLLKAMERILAQAPEEDEPQLAVALDRITVAEGLRHIVHQLRRHGGRVTFERLFPPGSGRLRIVVTFLALLELLRRGRVRAEQTSPFAPIEIISAGNTSNEGQRHDH